MSDVNSLYIAIGLIWGASGLALYALGAKFSYFKNGNMYFGRKENEYRH